MSNTIRRRSQRAALLAAVSGLVLSTCAPTADMMPPALVAESRIAPAMAAVPELAVAAPQLAVVPALPSTGSDVARPADAVDDVADDAAPTADDVVGESTEPQVADPITFDPVAAQQPRVRVAGVASPDVVSEILAVDGVAFATAVVIGDVSVAGADGPVSVRVAAVDPAGFRVLTPQVTADAVAVWQRISEGDAAFTHDVGHQLAVPLGSSVAASDRTTLRIGAYASNGIPPIADAIVNPETAAELGLVGVTELLIAVAADADPAEVGERVTAITGGRPEVIADPVQQEAFLSGAESRQAFEPFTYIDNGDGMIQIDPAWVRRNIVSAPVPILGGDVVCHRLMIDQLRGALQEIQDSGLAHLIDPSQYGGCWVPRHIDFNPGKPLSMHAWGLAADFNVSTNGLGQTPQLDPRIVEVFDRWGFNWGGRWRRPDGMHFELGALLSTGGQG